MQRFLAALEFLIYLQRAAGPAVQRHWNGLLCLILLVPFTALEFNMVLSLCLVLFTKIDIAFCSRCWHITKYYCSIPIHPGLLACTCDLGIPGEDEVNRVPKHSACGRLTITAPAIALGNAKERIGALGIVRHQSFGSFPMLSLLRR